MRLLLFTSLIGASLVIIGGTVINDGRPVDDDTTGMAPDRLARWLEEDYDPETDLVEIVNLDGAEDGQAGDLTADFTGEPIQGQADTTGNDGAAAQAEEA